MKPRVWARVVYHRGKRYIRCLVCNKSINKSATKAKCSSKFHLEATKRSIAREIRFLNAHPELRAKYKRASFYRRSYGIEISDYEDMLKEQHNCCALCGISLRKYKQLTGRIFDVEHVHNLTKKVRGLTCHERIGLQKINSYLLVSDS